LLDFELLEDLPRIINRRHQIIEEGEETKRMTGDFSLVIVALRLLATNTNLPAQVTQAYLAITANINELKPPINTINATTQTTATTVNSVSNVVQSTATKVDDLAAGLTNVRTTVNPTATRGPNVANKLDDDAGTVNNVSTKLDDVGSAFNRTFNILQEIFEEITKRLDRWAKWLRLPIVGRTIFSPFVAGSAPV
jgi:methyl-accepting chemotaxis protein